MSRASLKTAQGANAYQQKRREEALQRQAAGRNARLRRAREALLTQLGADTTEDEEIRDAPDAATEQAASAPAHSGRAGAAAEWAAQLMQPEWLIDVPERLAQDWYVLPRPEGARCLLVARGGRTISRTRQGRLLHRFRSPLPGGGLVGSPGTGGAQQQGGGDGGGCVVDAVWQEAAGAYLLLDVLVWRGYCLTDCTAEFRAYWLQSKLQEEAPAVLAGGPLAGCPYRLQLVPRWLCTPEGLTAAHSGAALGWGRDGVLLLHREGHYAAGATPLALQWKDAACSPYVLDTDAQGVVPPHQLVVLTYRADRTVATEDDPPVVLGRLPEAAVAQLGPRLRAGRLLRFSIRAGGVTLLEGQPVGADLHYEGLANQRRGRADSVSKILFQHYARTAPLTLDRLLVAAAATAAATTIAASAGDGDDGGGSDLAMGDGLLTTIAAPAGDSGYQDAGLAEMAA